MNQPHLRPAADENVSFQVVPSKWSLGSSWRRSSWTKLAALPLARPGRALRPLLASELPEQEREAAMSRRVTDGPGDELRRQHENLRRRTNWEDPARSLPDPDWESPHRPGSGSRDPLQELRSFVEAVLRRRPSGGPRR
jgi:hypothetical protein